MLKNILSNEIITNPDTIQFAKDRKYEEAWIIKRSGRKPSDSDIEQYIDDECETLIVEYIWNTDKYDSLFVLTIFLDNSCKIKKHLIFIKKCLEYFYSYKNFDGPFHGLKTPCCFKQGETWIVDENKVRYWVDKLLN